MSKRTKANIQNLGTFSVLSYALLCGCGKQAPVIEGIYCKKSGETSSAKNPSALQLTAQDQVLGVGYIDVRVNNTQGEVKTRRCTMKFKPESDDSSRLQVFTATHCLFPVASDDFKNSSYTLQVYHKGGYFPVAIEFDGLLNLNKLAQKYDPMLNLIPSENSRWSFAATENSVEPCKAQTALFAQELGQKKKNIACFSKNELRLLIGKVVVQPKFGKLWKTIFEANLAHSKEIFAGLNEREKAVLRLREKTGQFTGKVPAHLRRIGYWLNPKHCSLPNEQQPKDEDGDIEPKNLCNFRDEILTSLSQSFPNEYRAVSTIADAPVTTPAELAQLHQSVIACSFTTIGEIELNMTEAKSVCDIEKLSRLIWDSWVKNGVPETIPGSSAKGLFGVGPESYFSLSYNDKSDQNGKSWGAVATINPSLGELSSAKFNSQTMMLNFENGKEGLKLIKSDSGSLLTVFGILPVATLSTLDGEPTSGGSSITPLPEVNPESDGASGDASGASVQACK
jgi:hypothetical protein